MRKTEAMLKADIIELIIETIEDLPARSIMPVTSMAMACRKAYFNKKESEGGDYRMTQDERLFINAFLRADPKFQQVAYQILIEHPKAKENDRIQIPHNADGTIDFQSVYTIKRAP